MQSLRHNAEIDLKSVQLHSLKWVEVLVVLLQGSDSCEHPGVTALLTEAACGQAGCVQVFETLRRREMCTTG